VATVLQANNLDDKGAHWSFCVSTPRQQWWLKKTGLLGPGLHGWQVQTRKQHPARTLPQLPHHMVEKRKGTRHVSDHPVRAEAKKAELPF
jgi:hypothetical protein